MCWKHFVSLLPSNGFPYKQKMEKRWKRKSRLACVILSPPASFQPVVRIFKKDFISYFLFLFVFSGISVGQADWLGRVGISYVFLHGEHGEGSSFLSLFFPAPRVWKGSRPVFQHIQKLRLGRERKKHDNIFRKVSGIRMILLIFMWSELYWLGFQNLVPPWNGSKQTKCMFQHTHTCCCWEENNDEMKHKKYQKSEKKKKKEGFRRHVRKKINARKGQRGTHFTLT